MKTDLNKRLQYFPITFFSIIMGMAGLTIALSKAYHLQWLPEWPFLGMLFITTILFLTIFSLYIYKFIMFPEEITNDYQHQIKMNFMPTISISILLLSIAFLGKWPLISAPLWYIGTILHTILTFHIISKWIRHKFEINFFNPAWFIPVVGNILIPVAGVEFAPKYLSLFYFSAGVFFWIILSAIAIYRLIFFKTMPKKFMPTLFILLAPPAVAFISYIRITQSYDLIAQAFLMLTYFILILLLFLIKVYKNMPFFLSWWAYSFPLASFTIASIVAFQLTDYFLFKIVSLLGLSSLIIVVLFTSYHTIINIKNKKICIKED